MPRIRINCPHCDQTMEVNEADADRQLRCTRCQESFRRKTQSSAIPRTEVKAAADKEVIGVTCHECGKRFGIKRSMSGKTLACPGCKAQQIVDVVDASKTDSAPAKKQKPAKESHPKENLESGSSKIAASKRKPKTRKGSEGPDPVVSDKGKKKSKQTSSGDKKAKGQAHKKKPESKPPAPRKDSLEDTVARPTTTTSTESPSKPKKIAKEPPLKATVVDSSDHKMNVNEGSPEYQKALALLPPKYTVPKEVDQKVTEEIRESAPKGISLGIDTEVTRIHGADGAVEIQSLSVDQKRRRKRWRVIIVFLFSVIVLVAWFLWLLGRFDTVVEPDESESRIYLQTPAGIDYSIVTVQKIL